MTTDPKVKEAFIAGVFFGNGRIDDLCCLHPHAPKNVATREQMFQDFLARTGVPTDEAMHVEPVVAGKYCSSAPGRPDEVMAYFAQRQAVGDQPLKHVVAYVEQLEEALRLAHPVALGMQGELSS